MTITLTQNPYNKRQAEYGANLDIATVIDWVGDILPENFIWYAAQELSCAEYPELYNHVVKYGMIVDDAVREEQKLYGKYAYCAETNTFKLPLFTDDIVTVYSDGTTHVNGQKIEAGLPNVTGSVSNILDEITGGSIGSGALSYSVAYATAVPRGVGKCSHGILSLDLSRSNSIYKNGATVQPEAIALRKIIKYR